MLNKKPRNNVAKILLDIGSIKFSFKKPFILTSGLKSPVYVDCRKIISFKKERNLILNQSLKYFKDKKLKFEILAGGETAGIPYAAFLADRMNKQMIYVRKKPKGFGKNKQIEGSFLKGQKSILIEDLATDGGSKKNFINTMRKSGLKVNDIFVIFYYDIFDINKTPLAKLNINMHSLCTWHDVITTMKKNKIYSKRNIQDLTFFLNNPLEWRKKNG